MANFMTNKGAFNMRSCYFPGTVAKPTNFSVRLYSAATTPTVDTDLSSELSELATAGGYTSGGIVLTANGTNFPVTEDDTNDWAQFDIPDQQLNGTGAGFAFRWVGLVDDTTGDLVHVWDPGSLITVNAGQPLNLIDLIGRSDTVP